MAMQDQVKDVMPEPRDPEIAKFVASTRPRSDATLESIQQDMRKTLNAFAEHLKRLDEFRQRADGDMQALQRSLG